GFPSYCYENAAGAQGPLLRVRPGDRLDLRLHNALPPGAPLDMGMGEGRPCGNATLDASSTNIHFHGMTIAPTCHVDDVLHTVINSGERFTYAFEVPTDSAPGLYWYHPHIHSLSEAAVQGGASGPLIVEGIERLQPAVAGLPERVLVLRDSRLPEATEDVTGAPAWDVSVNYVPIPYPHYTPATLTLGAGERQFWRVVNAGADIIMDLQLVYDGVVQPLQLVALDNMVLRLEANGTTTPHLQQVTHVRIPPAGRAELIVQGPTRGVQNARLLTRAVDTGPEGDVDPARPLANLLIDDAALAAPTLPLATATRAAPISAALHGKPDKVRTLFFSEGPHDPEDPDDSDTNFFITEVGQSRHVFGMDDAPAIVVRQGTQEDWLIENRSGEIHVFHQHQIHFTLLERDGVPVPPA
ncbi:MAG TPA: multicopper oxidase domain-containing protein, partial [Myxococcota bacterium]|nr:multicopper oxidase domain-containing protein [Myxococcota bacterium]